MRPTRLRKGRGGDGMSVPPQPAGKSSPRWAGQRAGAKGFDHMDEKIKVRDLAAETGKSTTDVMRVLREEGIDFKTASSSISREDAEKVKAHFQPEAKSAVSRKEVQPGDLLFFTGRASRSGRVGHVGIAVSADPVSGEITFIHAARSGIRIDKLSAPYYAARFLSARRVLPD